MGAPIVLSMSAYVSISVSDSAGGQIAHVVIDSSAFDAGTFAAAMPPQMLQDPKGISLHAFFVNGKTKSMQPSAENLQAMQLVPALQLLLAATHAAAPGDKWVDSTLADTTVAGGTSKANLVTTWTASRAPDGSVLLDGDVVGTTSFGSGAMQLDMQTTGTSHAATSHAALPPSATSSTTGQASMNMGGQNMAMKLQIEVSATLIP
jgi:hypothetical protein